MRSSTRRSTPARRSCSRQGSKQVKTGFKVGPKEGGYYISFSDADLEALLSEYLREKVSRMLFKA